MKVFLIISIIYLALFLYVLFNWLGSEKMHKNTLTAFVGSMGTGKTKIAVEKALNKLRRERIKWYIRKYIPIHRRSYCKGWKALLPFEIRKEKYPKPQLYSNIPIRIKGSKMSIKLTKEHLIPKIKYSDENKYWLYKKQIIPNSIVLIDEIGQFASQYDWEVDNVKNGLTPLIRFCRHWGMTIYVTDQTADSIAKGIRSRLGMIYFLNDFRKPFYIFYKVRTIPMIIAEDNTSQTGANKGDNLKYFFGWLGRKGKHYDSLCHSELYKRKDLKNYDNFNPLTLKSDYFIDLREKKLEKRKK